MKKKITVLTVNAMVFALFVSAERAAAGQDPYDRFHARRIAY